MKILVDADGCPVIDIAIELAQKHGWECLLFADPNHLFQKKDARVLVAEQGADSADFLLLSYSRPNDIVVTQDYGLAALALARQAQALSPDGLIYTADNIDSLLESRHFAKKLRRSGKHLKGPRKRTDEQDRCFYQALEKMIGDTDAL